MRKKEQNNEKAIKNSICFVRKNYLNLDIFDLNHMSQ